MQLRRFVTPGLSINSYLISDEESRRGIVVDPTRQVENYIAQARKDGIEITDIIETHVHADYISGAVDLKAALNGKPTIHCSGLGGKEWTPHYADHIVKEREEIQLGTVRLQALHTPGHTPEHIIWLVFNEQRSRTIPEMAFTGDLLFVGSVGRPDLMGEELEKQLVQQLYRSLFGTIQALPDFIQIFPGHGAGSLCGKEISTQDSSTIGYERRCNPWLIPQDFKRWQYHLLENISSPPAYFQRMKRLNVTGLNRNNQLPSPPPLLQLEQIPGLLSTCVVVDIRNQEAFSSGHFKGSVNIPFGPSFITWAGIALAGDRDLILVAGSTTEIPSVIQSLRLIGLDQIKGIFIANESSFASGDLLSMMEAADLKTHLSDYYVLDVRTPAEWNSGHIEGAHHIELAQLPNSISAIPKDVPIVVTCRSGARASLAASLLINAGYPRVQNLRGGMMAWGKCEPCKATTH